MSTPARILVVDDEAAVRDVVADVLGESGYLVETATSAAQALQALGHDPWDLVLVDVRLGDQPGPELAREILRQRPELAGRIIFVTGDLSTGPEVTPVIRKPFSVDTMLDAVRRQLALAGAVAGASHTRPPAGF